MTTEQNARDMLERMGVPDAQAYSAGEVVELANLIADADIPVALAEAYRCGKEAGDAEIAELRQQLATFHSAVEHVTEDGCMRRSFVATPEGWAMVHKDRLHDLTVAEEQLAEREKQAVLLRDALDDLASCMHGVIEGDYTPDSFTLQPANTALAATEPKP